MNRSVTMSLVMLSMTSLALLSACSKQETEPKNAEPKSMETSKNMEVSKEPQSAADKAMAHQATGVVKQADSAKGTVTLAHEPVQSLKWPAMTMRFAVKDKLLFDKLATGKKVEFEFMQQGSEYVVTAVK